MYDSRLNPLEKWEEGTKVAANTGWTNLPKIFALFLYVMTVTFCGILAELKEIKEVLKRNG